MPKRDPEPFDKLREHLRQAPFDRLRERLRQAPFDRLRVSRAYKGYPELVEGYPNQTLLRRVVEGYIKTS